jgi:hypothetical protein
MTGLPPAPSRPAISIAPRWRTALTRALRLAAVLAIGAACPDAARAACSPDPASTGDAVSCTGSDADGFQAGAAEDLTVDVSSIATVDNGGVDGTPAIDLNSGNTVTNSGTITASGNASSGISVVDGSTVNNDGRITVSTGIGAGIAGGSDNEFSNSGSITLSGGNSFGMLVGDGGTARANNLSNSGTITLSGANATGMQAGDASAARASVLNNTGTITLSGANGTGMRAGLASADRRNSITNEGTITLSGAGSTGIWLGSGTATADNRATNDGTIEVLGSNGVGIEANDRNLISVGSVSRGVIELFGNGGVGIRGNDDTTIVIGEDALIGGTGSDDIGDDTSGIALGISGGSDNTVTNLGVIRIGSGSGAGVSFAGSVGGTNRLANAGRIDAGAGDAIVGSDAVEIIFNSGRIRGDLSLRGGADELTLDSQGTVVGQLDGGGGFDTLILQGDGSNALDLVSVSNFETLAIDATGGTWTLGGNGSFSNGASVIDGAPRSPPSCARSGPATSCWWRGTSPSTPGPRWW